MDKKIIQMDISVGTGIFTALGRQDVKTDQIFREFIDNSTSSYFDHKNELDSIYSDYKCNVDITWDDEKIVIVDNAFGMNQEEFNRALKINSRAEQYSSESRSQYGLGLKYALASLGKWFRIESTAYNSKDLFSVEVDLEELSRDQPNTLPVEVNGTEKVTHGTKIVIRKLTKKLNNTLASKRKNKGKVNKVDDLIKKLAIIYKHDIENQLLEIRVNKQKVKVTEREYLKKETGGEYWASFSGKFLHGDQNYEYSGWLGILSSAKIEEAGFTIVQKGRAIQLNYRPESLFGRGNDFRYQRVIGEINLDNNNWIVTFTKDAIKWEDNGLQEAFIEDLFNKPDVRELFKVAKDYRVRSKKLDLKKVKKMKLGDNFIDVNTNINNKPNISEEITDNIEKKDKIEGDKITNQNKKEDTIKSIQVSEEKLIEKKVENLELDVKYNDTDYIFALEISNDENSEQKFLRITVDEKNTNKYFLKINDTVALFERYTNLDTKKLILQIAICLTLSALESQKKGVSLSDSQKFIEQLNTIINNVKSGV